MTTKSAIMPNSLVVPKSGIVTRGLGLGDRGNDGRSLEELDESLFEVD